MIDVNNDLTEWRAEIAAELDTARVEHEEAQAGLVAAERERATVLEKLAAFRAATDRLAEAPAMPLFLRLREIEADDRRTATNAATARRTIHAASDRIRELEHALAQIDTMTAPPTADAENAEEIEDVAA